LKKTVAIFDKTVSKGSGKHETNEVLYPVVKQKMYEKTVALIDHDVYCGSP